VRNDSPLARQQRKRLTVTFVSSGNATERTIHHAKTRRLEMAIDEKLATHVRSALAGASPVREIKMFGGLGFMLNGNMIAAASDRGLLVRVGEQHEAEALARPGAQLMVMNGRAMKGFVRVTTALDARSVKSWLRLARSFVDTLPAKTTTTKPKRRRSKAS
jgi:TfoX/Sxy family transcriptional regulator of competence genes